MYEVQCLSSLVQDAVNFNAHSQIHMITQPNANPPKQKQQKMTSYQPPEKTLSKFVDKINVGKDFFSQMYANFMVII